MNNVFSGLRQLINGLSLFTEAGSNDAPINSARLYRTTVLSKFSAIAAYGREPWTLLVKSDSAYLLRCFFSQARQKLSKSIREGRTALFNGEGTQALEHADSCYELAEAIKDNRATRAVTRLRASALRQVCLPRN